MKPLAERKTLKPRAYKGKRDKTVLSHVRMLPELREQFHRQAEELGLTFSEAARQALSEFFGKRLHKGEN
jgi:hypothetical protein